MSQTKVVADGGYGYPDYAPSPHFPGDASVGGELDVARDVVAGGNFLGGRVPLTAITTTPVNVANNTLVDVTTLPVDAGKTYNVRARLPISSVAAAGQKVALSGTATVTTASIVHILYQQHDASTTFAPAVTMVSGKTGIGDSQEVDQAGTTLGVWTIEGAVKVTVSGTLVVRFAQKTTNATASTIAAGALFQVTSQ